MATLVERSIAFIERRLILLSPSRESLTPAFSNVAVDGDRHSRLLEEVQRLRGAVYLADGAVKPDQLTHGLHRTAEDSRSWHLLLLGKDRRVTSCAWYMLHDHNPSVDDLRVRSCAMANSPLWNGQVRTAIENELAKARATHVRYAELGGWAVSKESRCTSEALILALASYSLARFLGGALGITTATVRHSSAAILRRLGGSSLEANGADVPPYYDPKYSCEMELIRFDSRRPSGKYLGLIEAFCHKLVHVPVLVSATQAASELAA